MRGSLNCNNYPGLKDLQGSQFSNIDQNFVRRTNTVEPNKYQSFQGEEEEEKKKKDKAQIEAFLKKCREIQGKANKLFSESKINEGFKELDIEQNYLQKLKKLILEKNKYLFNYLSDISGMLKEVEQLKSLYSRERYKIRSVFNEIISTGRVPKVRELLLTPPINFGDIYIEIPNFDKTLYNLWLKTNITNHKTFCLYGPQGSGKTLITYALASLLKCKIIQIDSLDMFKKIPDFAHEIYISSKDVQPLIIFFRNIEQLAAGKAHINYIIDKVIEKKENHILIVFSSNYPPNSLPSEISRRIVYFHYIPSAKNKGEFIKFLGAKLNLPFDLSEDDMVKISQNLYLYSNQEITNVVELAGHKRREMMFEGNEIGITYNDIMSCSKMQPPTLTEQQFSYLNQTNFTNVTPYVEKAFTSYQSNY